MLDFTLTVYQQFLDMLKEKHFHFSTFADYAKAQLPDSHHVILRHDVDRLPSRSLTLARVEADNDVKATYFFRTKPVSFNKKIMSEIKAMGHEIGYHYENMSDARGNVEKAWVDFQKNLDIFDKHHHDITSIAMHGRPFSPWDNHEMWKHKDYRDLGVKLEAYLDVDYDNYPYYTDVGRRWDGKGNRRDRVANMEKAPKSTLDLIDNLSEQDPRPVIISTHPERWSSHPIGWTQVFLTDLAINTLKQVLR